MSTDGDKRVSHTADRELQDIEKKYPGFIHMKLMRGIRLSYALQQVRAQSGRQTIGHHIPNDFVCVVQVLHKKDVIRGFRITEGELPAALNGYLYSILKVLAAISTLVFTKTKISLFLQQTKSQRRAILMNLLKQFDDTPRSR